MHSLYLSFIMVAASMMMVIMPHFASASTPLRPFLPAPAQSYTISGAVRNHDKTPVMGAHVSTGFLDPEMAFATTDDQGN
jgi:hypothetical protein